jgi:hypothetical protein
MATTRAGFNWRGALFTFLRVAVTLALLYYLYRKVDWINVGHALSAAHLAWLIPAALGFFAFVLISNWRWKVLLDARGLHFSFGYLLKVYLVASMFNNVLPTAIGGDVARIAYTVRDQRTAEAFAAALVDRIIGFIGLFFFAFCTSVLIWLTTRRSLWLVLNLAGFVALVVITLTLFSDTMHRIVMAIFGRIRILKLGARIDRLYQAVKGFRTVRWALLWSFLASLGIQFVIALTWFLIALAPPALPPFGRPPLLYYCLLIPLIGIITMLPSIGGLGLRENSFVGFFTAEWMEQAMSRDQAAATAVLYLIITIVFAAIGFVVFQTLKRAGAQGVRARPAAVPVAETRVKTQGGT